MKNIILLMFILPLLPACKNLTDSITSATKPKTKVFLPLEKGDYEVIGILPGLKNFVVKYDSKFYRGGDIFSEQAFDSLTNLGIKTIISVTPTDFEKKFSKKILPS